MRNQYNTKECGICLYFQSRTQTNRRSTDSFGMPQQKVKNISLNSVLLLGPDQLISLPEVLHRFRERKISIIGDIREMFHQIRIRDQDQHLQRFLWRNDPKTDAEVYVMCVMMFGATCSLSSAQFVKNINANSYKKTHPRAVTAILNNYYVDDMIENVDTIEEAVKLINDVKTIHSHAGFEIRNWASNSAVVLQMVEGTLNEKTLQIGEEGSQHKVLGMWWHTESDTFTYTLKYNKANAEVLSGHRRPTKREVLRTLMSTFDKMVEMDKDSAID